MAAFLAGYIGLHFIGVGAFADIVMGVSGWVMMGAAIFTGLDQLYKFAYLTLRGRTDRDLNDAARSLAEAIATLGLTAVLNFLGGKVARRGKVSDAFSGKTEKFKSFKEYLSKKIEQDGNKPPKTTYLSSKSDLDSHNWRPNVYGQCDFLGNITVTEIKPQINLATGRYMVDGRGDFLYERRPYEDIKRTYFHEKLHRALTPKADFLRNYRVTNKAYYYNVSSLARYIEEALAQSYGHMKVDGFSWNSIKSGLVFPVKNGYVSWTQKSQDARGELRGLGVIPETGHLLYQAYFKGVLFEIFFYPATPKDSDKLIVLGNR